ncbi:hypothetical protein MMC13_000021 [Lambiella insularis]|nr:hypothetical protein [Lambiella insularis]
MTDAIVAAIKTCSTLEDGLRLELDEDYPSLEAPTVGKPISHTQLLAISKCLKEAEAESSKVFAKNMPAPIYHLDNLLRGSRVYVEPPKPKAEPTPEYKALMARLRKDEEARSYERMINPPLLVETFSRRFPPSAPSQLFQGDLQPSSVEDEEITYADVNRQVALIFNILISIVACSAAIWMAASHWSTPKRLGISMGGSGVVGIAEVVVYAGYLRRLKEAKAKGKKEIETKEIMETWVIGGEEKLPNSVASVAVASQKEDTGDIRRRKTKGKS